MSPRATPAVPFQPPGPARRTIGLIDVASMFVSCERVFRPDLEGKPVIVLSNNDGCAVALSKEAKEAEVVMGAPWYRLRTTPSWHRAGGIALSSNYELYGELSSRFYATLRTLYSPENLEVYSIDEVFVRAPRTQATARAHEAIERVGSWVGLPCSMGLGPTKTLAKCAQRIAKSGPTSDQVINLAQWPTADVADALAATPVSEVWGVGRKLTEHLTKLGVATALDLATTDPLYLRHKFGVVVERTARELGGTPCIPLGAAPTARQTIIHIRMLGRTISTHAELRDVFTAYTTRAHQRLRHYHLEAGLLHASASTSYYRPGFVRHEHPVALSPTTSVLSNLIDAAQSAVPHIPEGPEYNRAGIVLSNLRPAGVQPALFDVNAVADALDQALLDIRAEWGEGSVGYGVAGVAEPQRWAMRRDLLSEGTGDPHKRSSSRTT